MSAAPKLDDLKPVDLYAPAAPPPPPRKRVLAVDVVQAWKARGPLEHEPTGLPALDRLTGGGPVYRSRWYLLGAPDAGKTALLIQWAHVWAERGIAVGVVAVDEEGDDILTRVAQRSGFTRSDCELAPASVVDRMATSVERLPLVTYDWTWTIEAAARDLEEYRKTIGAAHGVLLVDSVQTVKCDALTASGRDLSERQIINANVAAIRAVATELNFIVIATSEMNRAAYRFLDDAENISELAAGKESGAIEYSARVLIALKSVQDSPDLIRCSLPKNKHGPKGELHLSIDRKTQTLVEAEPAEQASAEDKRLLADAATVLQVVIDSPGISEHKVVDDVRSRGVKMGKGRVSAALCRLVRDKLVELRATKIRGNDASTYYPIAKTAMVAPPEPRPIGMAQDVHGDDDGHDSVNGAAAASGALRLEDV